MVVANGIGFIGAGKVGCSLARYLREGGAELAGFSSCREESARKAAEHIGGRAFASALDVVRAADIVFLTVPDGSIRSVADLLAEAAVGERLDLSAKVFLHCSGAISSEALSALRTAGATACSLHPLYAVSSRFDCWRELSRAWFSVEGDEPAVACARELLKPLGNHVVRIDAANKTRYHASAVMASNLVVGLYNEAAEQLVQCGFTPKDAESALAPLFLGNAEHIARDGVAASLTGPAARGDAATVDAHLSCLSGDDREIYRLLTDVVYRIAARS